MVGENAKLTIGPSMILVVEDDTSLNQLIQIKLQELGFETEGFVSGEEAISWIEEHENIIVLLDYNLSDMLAVDVLKKLKDRNLDVPFIIMTGDGDERLAVEMMKKGAIDYIVKDLGFIEVLPAMLERALTHYDTMKKLDKSQLELIEREQKYRSIFENIQDIYFETDIEGDIMEMSPSVKSMLFYKREDLLGENISRLYIKPEKVHDFFKQLFEKNKLIDYEVLVRDAHDEYRYCAINCNIVIGRTSKAKKIVGTIRDITERKKLERIILNKVIEAEEREKQRFAEDLHDGLGPLLSSIKIYVNMLQSKNRSEEERVDLLKYTNELIDDAVSGTREIANNLMPSVLNDYGLVKAIDSFCRKIRLTKTIEIEFDQNLEERLNQTVEIVLYRTVLELINNTLKHANASIIHINLVRKGMNLDFTYSDDGLGFDYNKLMSPEHARGHGLRNIINRLKSINGECKFISKEGEGALVKINLDLCSFNDK